jgi:glycosyltransferase involved in cell wall biosynthesis
MHVCFLCNEYPPGQHGGIGSFTQTLGRRLAQQGCQVTVLGFYSVASVQHEDDQGVEVRRLPHTRLRGVSLWVHGLRLRRELCRLAAAGPLDVVDGPENAFAAVPPTAPGCKIIRMNGGHHFFATTLNRQPALWRAWLERRSFAHADHLAAVSRFVAETTRRLLHLGNVPIEILPNPVDTEHFRPMPQVPVMPGLIGFVGTLCEKKGIRQLVQAMPEIVAAVPEARLMACGRDSADQATGKSFRQTLQASLSSETVCRVTFAGHVENARLPVELAAAQVLVYPSHMEALPVAWLEGMAMGKPVAAGNAGPGPEIIQDGVIGLLCNPHDPHSIAAAVIRLLQDRPLAERLGAAARQRVTQEFSVERLVQKNQNFYRRCLGARQTAEACPV